MVATREMRDACDKMEVILNTAKAEGRGLTPKEKADFDRLEAEFNLGGGTGSAPTARFPRLAGLDRLGVLRLT